MAAPGYGYGHEVARAELLARSPVCYWCGRPGPTIADHDPPLCTFTDPRQWHGVYRASCVPCSKRQAQQLRKWKWSLRKHRVPAPSRPW